MYTVYILKCSDSTYYVGWTTDLIDRISRHQKGMVNYTSTRLPIEIAHYSLFTDKYKALEFELYLKSGSGRAFAIKRLYSYNRTYVIKDYYV